jgi:hypothetical protein
MHVKLNIFGIQEEGFYSHSGLYAYSDDMGKTFFVQMEVRSNFHFDQQPCSSLTMRISQKTEMVNGWNSGWMFCGWQVWKIKESVQRMERTSIVQSAKFAVL